MRTVRGPIGKTLRYLPTVSGQLQDVVEELYLPSTTVQILKGTTESLDRDVFSRISRVNSFPYQERSARRAVIRDRGVDSDPES